MRFCNLQWATSDENGNNNWRPIFPIQPTRPSDGKKKMQPKLMQPALFVSIALGIISSSHGIVIQPGERLSQLTEVTSSSRLHQSLSSTALLVPDEEISDNVVFQLKSIGTSVQGYDNLKRISRAWDQDFQCEVGVTASISRISAISQDVMLVQWNLTWVPPTAPLLEGSGKLL